MNHKETKVSSIAPLAIQSKPLEQCARCCESFTSALLIHLDQCQHRICKICIHDWHHLSNSPTCPICQLPIAAAQLSRIHHHEHNSNHNQPDEVVKTVQSAGGILVRQMNGTLYYLALLQKRQNGDLQWIAPKGHIEGKEHSLAAAKREIEEETGLKSIKLIDFVCKQNFCFKESQNLYRKTIFWYLFKVEQPNELILNEEEGFIMSKWLTYAKAQHLFTHEAFIQIIAIAHHMLSNSSQLT